MIQPWKITLANLHFVVIVLCLNVGVLKAQQFDNADIHGYVDSAPDWVQPHTLELNTHIPIDELSNGVYYQLIDKQINVDADGLRTMYSRFSETVVNQSGIETSSQINIDFDPSYQRLTLNSLQIWRNGNAINKLDTAIMSVFNRETELDRQIYNGSLTLNILLDDIQEGDTIDYSYTRIGSNPVYRSIFSYQRTLNWSVPVHQQRLRVRWGKQTPLHVTLRNADYEITTQQLAQVTEYQLNITDATVVKTPAQVPNWYQPWGKVYFNESESWADVVAWAAPMYNFGSPAPEITQIAQQILEQHTSPDGQIAAALQYVQEHIRYVGLEMGENSHFPTQPEETLSLKYGDCKDKTSLFIAILHALNIDAFPALVNTENTQLLTHQPAGVNLFNHVIAQVTFEGKYYWLDPTLRKQPGTLANLYQPDYGYALVLAPGSTQLTSMRQVRDSYTYINEKYSLEPKVEDPVTYAVTTSYKGSEATRMQLKLDREGKAAIADSYETYYQGIFPHLKASEALSISTNDTSGVITFKEAYDIQPYWELGDEHWEAEYYPSEIRNAVYKPEQTQRDGPLDFTYPNNLTQLIEVEFKESGWDLTGKAFEEDNPFFSYRSSVTFANNLLTLRYQYSSKTDHIAATDISAYLEARERLRDDAYYSIVKYKKDDSQEPQEEDIANDSSTDPWEMWLKIGIVGYLSGLLYLIFAVRAITKNAGLEESLRFHPISVGKFIVMSVFTFGIYDAYWIYRNWHTIKQQTQEDILPFWRAVFSVIWIYPLYLRLKQDKQTLSDSPALPNTWLAIMLCIGYFICLFTSSFYEGRWSTFISFGCPVLLLPFIFYINHRNQGVNNHYVKNSQWGLRHLIAVLMISPIVLFSVFSELRLIPSDGIVSQSQMWNKDLKFLYRNKMLPASENVEYFYSDALLDMREDGNGFTSQRVFSYWQNDTVLEIETAMFSEISKIDVEYAQNDLDNTIVTVTRHNDSDFMLFVSTVNGGDKQFVKTLMKYWDLQKTEP